MILFLWLSTSQLLLLFSELSPCQIKATEATGLTNMEGFKVVEIVFFDFFNEFYHFIGGGILLMGLLAYSASQWQCM